ASIGCPLPYPPHAFVVGRGNPLLAMVVGMRPDGALRPGLNPGLVHPIAYSPMATDGNMVEIRNVTKIYQQGEIHVTALNHISLDIQAGEFLALMGPSDSGKSTLLHIIAGIDRPTSGECRVHGIEVTR